MRVELKNTKYVLVREGGGWSHFHDLFIVMNDGNVYLTHNWKPDEVIPENSIDADCIGKIDDSLYFDVPQKCIFVMDAPYHMVFDETLDKSIYKGFGVEEEFKAYFDNITCLTNLRNQKKFEELKKSYLKNNQEYIIGEVS